MDAEPLCRLPRLPAHRRRGRRVQRQVHGQPDGAARRGGGDAGRASALDLSQLLSIRRALGVRGDQAGGGRMRDNRALAQFRDLAPGEESFREAVLAGLSARQKSIPCRFLYDDRGSELFEAIGEPPEYYPTRTETAILETYAGEIGALAGPDCQLV